MRILAFDPGDVWLGFAAIQIDDDTGSVRRPVTELHAMTRVFHIKSRTFAGAAMEAVIYTLGREPTILVAEDFRIQSVGHNHFNRGQTLRMLGALEYAASQYQKTAWAQVPPGNAEKELPQLLGPTFFTEWQQKWRRPRDANWRHARSAWRVLARYLMKHNLPLLRQIRDERTHATFRTMPNWLTFRQELEEDRYAPAARFTLVEKAR